jgi:5-methylcytosine-specific restriction endonuclease McrA
VEFRQGRLGLQRLGFLATIRADGKGTIRAGGLLNRPKRRCHGSDAGDIMDHVEAETAPRLTIELVPKTCWFSNVRDRVSRQDWDRIRSQVYEQADRRCEVCGGRGSRHPVECHEVWEYDDASGVQRLVRMIALCPACHEVKHIGLAGMKGRGDLACAHLAEVNGWTSEVAARCVEDAFAVWRTRSSRTWALDVSALAAYGIDPAIIAEASEASATGRSRTAASTTTKVRRSQPIPPTDPA